ncbi:Hint domain-containing protein [Roseicyclus marinus]|uniref:Hint domain-containing protein n=1 Tax=Roseicyclus marinus TaxID=2161673 RepID=UPI00240EA219|nr:Hint domain-containing protein [Roseicyclus marinus]MDG3040302.1 Hint domain-containing protein [Roseicyclus marinus]
MTPARETYAYLAELTGSPETGFTVGAFNGPTGGSYLEEFDSNGIADIGDLLFWSGFNFPVTLEGFSATGDPVLRLSRRYYLVSDTPLTTGANIGFTTTGTYAFCFAPGTGIATPAGEVPVEHLRIGDTILTADGRAVPVRWIGRQTLSKLFAGDRARPVLIRAGALGQGLPHRDLIVTADHGMILDGFVINAGALVNGTTITRVPLSDLPARVTYYHVETASHDVILAQGAAAETFVDYAGRAAFDNHADYLARYGHASPIPEMTRPRITTARHIPAALRARLGLQGAAPTLRRSV